MSKTFKDIKYGANNNTVLLVDGLNLSFRFKHKRQRNFGPDYLRTIDSLAASYGCSKIIVCSDKGGSSYRKEIYPEYKGNRKEKFDQQTEEEEQEFLQFLADYEDALDLVSTSYPVIRYQGVEADDLIAAICKNSTLPIWIISTDKDLDQLIAENISRFSYITRKEVTYRNFKETYGCTPEEYISVKVLQGDTGDNVKGIEGIGPKRALGLVKQYGSAFDIYDAIPLEGKQKFIQAVNEAKDLILLNYKLMDLNFYKEAIGEYYGLLVETLKKENVWNI